MSDPHSPLRLNVGFVVAQFAGFSRDFPFDVPQISLPPDLQLSNLVGLIRTTRTPQGILLQADLQAQTELECVRCLTDFSQALETKIDDLFVYPPGQANDPLLAVPETGILDLNPLLREYFLLDVPLQPVCRQDCRGLCPECGNNLNESSCTHPVTTADPRLAGLKSLLPES